MGAGPYRDVAVGVPKCRGVVGFDVPLVHGRRVELMLDDEVGFGESRFNVALLESHVGSDVTDLVGSLTKFCRSNVFVDRLCSLFHCLLNSHELGKHFVFYGD